MLREWSLDKLGMISPPLGDLGRKNIRINHNASDDVGAERCCNFSFPPRSPPYGGLQGDHFIVPRTPFRMAICTFLRGSNLHTRTLPNLLRIALHWKNSVLEIQSR